MELKINSSDGLVLLADGRRHSGAVLTLSVSKGHLVLLVDGPSGRDSLRPKKKYNDNQWHTVRPGSSGGFSSVQDKVSWTLCAFVSSRCL